jgi:GT2 family glycosyltransferase
MDDDILIFCHDDIYLLDYYWIDVIVTALNKYDIVGLAGNTERIKMQPSWLFSDITLSKFNQETLSGIVAHGRELPPQNLTIYGAPDQQVELLDGLLLAVKDKTIKNNNLCFDEQFCYDFYDLDFCRLARSKGLTLGTMALSVMHESGGNFNTDQWNEGYKKYIDKWKN